ncbi:glycosyltransferase family 4 protein [Bacillus sp. 7884-1]|uniref:glycosyltransferase family 4 protein n=1 Tax=Bacillus sp. 7884-1 TaxID=2021693 RepID=UPI000BA74780|nr:glycosyltransferase family 4 protein [Bacillus sp. 7884-1]PAE44076.1 glycosyl transferase [Bacillus sp. 7884-1]
MKILLATFWSIPHVGGVWNYMKQLKERLESLGHEVDLLGYGEDNNYLHIVTKKQVIENNRFLPVITKVYEQTESSFYHKNPILYHYENLRYCFELGAAYFDLEKYDLIHTQDVLSTACINRIRPQGTALVATLHGSVAHEMKHYATTVNDNALSNSIKNYFDKMEYSGATAAEFTIVANNWMKDSLTNDFHVPVEQLKVLHYGYDIDTFVKRMNRASSIQRSADKKVILYAGRLVEIKGVQNLIQALSQLKRLRNDWVCWIAGDGNKKADLQHQSKALGLEKDILFLGKRDDIPSLLSISDIFVHPSLLDNQPLSVIEAQIAGKPVIVSDAGGLPEMIEHGVTGLITPAGKDRSLCLHLDSLLTNDQLRKTLGSNAKKWALTYWSIDTAVKNVLEVYQSALTKKKNAL